MKALHNESVDKLVWAPNFDYWLNVNRAENTLPAKYVGMSRNDIVRAVGGYIWNRAEGITISYDSSVQEVWTDDNGDRILEYHTPIGSIKAVYKQSEGKHRSRILSEHFIKTVDDIKIRKYVAEATILEPNYEPTKTALTETGEDGVVLNSYFCVPFIQFAKTDAGYINAYYLWTDHRSEVESLLDVHHKKFIEGYSILAAGPADIIATGDNMDGVMISPDIFKQYAVPFYQEAKKIVHSHGKLFEGHWCGRTQTLLPLVPGCGLDLVEAIVTSPMADITLNEAIDMLDGKVVLQGGVPAVMVCDEGGSRKDFEKYMQNVILPLKGRKGFILGMSDNVPPNADFWRVEQIATMIS